MSIPLRESGMAVIEPQRRIAYDESLREFDRSGVDPNQLFDNNSYYRRDENGSLIELCGSHPTLIHWPLAEYDGGTELIQRLKQEVTNISAIAGAWNVAWVSPRYWHCTVFSPIHSSDPVVIARHEMDFENAAQKAVCETSMYQLDFSRMLVTSGAGIKAVAYCSNDELDALRQRLHDSVPHGSTSTLIHITLGNFVAVPDPEQMRDCKQYFAAFGTDQQLLGRIAVKSLCYAQYTGPFVRMSVKQLRRLPLKT